MTATLEIQPSGPVLVLSQLNREAAKSGARRRKGGVTFSVGSLPPNVWGEAIDPRKQITRPLTEISVSKLLKRLERWGEPSSIQALDEAVGNGWQSVFEPKKKRDPKNLHPETETLSVLGESTATAGFLTAV